MRTLAAPPLLLEALTVHHAREMFVLLGDPAIYEFENEPPASEEALARRYAMLERRASPDGREAWLNWVIRLPTGELAGCVQATVLATGAAHVAHELASRFWRRCIGCAAVAAMLDELRDRHRVRLFVAVFKARNHCSAGLPCKLGFEPAGAAQCAAFGAEADELTMVRSATAGTARA